MNISKKLVGCCLLLILVTAGSLQAQEKSPQDMEKSCRAFLQGFYDKFVRAQKSNNPTSYSYEQALGPELRRQLKADRDAQEKDTSGDIVGLDFDPIAAGNDVSDRYEVGTVTRKGDRFLVEVYNFWGKKRDASQKMVHEVMSSGGRWLIMNIHYYYYKKGKLSSQDDLLSMLKALREERRKNSK
jgi:hypothetical protein